MKYYYHPLATIVLVCFFFTAQGQNNISTIKGQLLNLADEPAAYSTVALYKSDSTLIKGAISNDAGYFVIESIVQGEVYLTVQNVEYSAYNSPIIKIEQGKIMNLKPIILEPTSLELSEVVVSSTRQLVEVLPDRMIFNVSSSVNASGNNGLELLSKAPGVVIDPDNNVILQGKSGVRIFINGRPSRLSGSDLATMLESMQSDNIELIELITNPSAKYEAEGNAGIINIKLKNNVTLGYNGNIISSYTKGDAPRLSNGASINYGKKKLSLTANFTRFDNVFQEGFEDYKEQSGFGLKLSSLEEKNRDGYNFSSSITYDLNDKHSVNISGGGVITKGDYDLISTTNIANFSDPNGDQTLVSHSITDYTSSNYNFNLNYIWEISENSSISSDLSYGSFVKDNNIDQPNSYFEGGGTTLIREANNRFDTFTDIKLYSAKVDYERNFDKIKLSAGTKYYKVVTENEFIVSDVVAGEATINPEESNTFNYTENVMAAYAIVDFQLIENLKASAGLRVEQTNSQGILESTQVGGNDDVQRNYTNLFPNISLAYSKGKSEFSISYGKRITRPSYQDLNPFEAKTSELVIWKGNPFLNPNFITNYQFTYSHKVGLVVSNTYSITEGYFARILQIVDETATFIVPQNMRRSTTNGLSISYPFNVIKGWDVSGFVVYNRSTFEGEFDNTNIDITTDIFNARIQNDIKLPWGIDFNIGLYYNSPWIWRGSIEIDQFYGVNMGVRKNLLKDKLQIRLTGSDIFNTGSDFDYWGNYGGINITGVYLSDNHRFGFGLTYKFGNQKIKNRSRKGGLNDELKRISN